MFDKNKLQSRLYSRISKSVEKALAEGADPNKRAYGCDYPLNHAVGFGRYKVASLLINADANVNLKGLDGLTPLHQAARIGNLRLAKLLVKNGADIHDLNDEGKTPLDVATDEFARTYNAHHIVQVISFLLTLKNKQQ